MLGVAREEILLMNCRDAVVQEDFMKACRKLNEAKKHEGAMSVLLIDHRPRLTCPI
jgi:ABC-type polysaccharide/polyol phosphate transport system ATPase subunit